MCLFFKHKIKKRRRNLQKYAHDKGNICFCGGGARIWIKKEKQKQKAEVEEDVLLFLLLLGFSYLNFKIDAIVSLYFNMVFHFIFTLWCNFHTGVDAS